MNVNDSNTKSDPISGATPMSDTKILSAEEFESILREITNGLSGTKLLRASHAAQAKRIEELEAREKEAHGVAGVCVNLFKGLQMLSEWKITEADFESLAARSEKDLTRGAEWLNGYVGIALKQLSDIQAALPAERALEIAEGLEWNEPDNSGAISSAKELRAYAHALRKEG